MEIWVETKKNSLLLWLQYAYFFLKSTKEIFNVQQAGYSPNMLPTIVHSQAFCYTSIILTDKCPSWWSGKCLNKYSDATNCNTVSPRNSSRWLCPLNIHKKKSWLCPLNIHKKKSWLCPLNIHKTIRVDYIPWIYIKQK